MKKVSYFLLNIILFNSLLFAQVPSNDNCNSSIELTVSPSCLQTVGTLSLATESIAPITCGVGTSSTSKDVWYNFIATSSTATINVSPNTQAGNNFNVVIGLYSACGGSLIICSDQYGNLQTETIQASGLAIGNIYYINVFQYKNSINSLDPANPTFSICVMSNNPTGVNEIQEDFFLLGPNPVESSIHLNDDFVTRTHSILIYDSFGRTVFYTDNISNTINLESIAKGAYYMLFIQKNGDYNPKERIIYRKLIKQ